MIQYVQGNIVESPAVIRVNTVNCIGAMGKGIARDFADAYPRLLRDYKAACNRKLIRPGSIWPWEVGDGRTIWNAATKNEWWNPSNYAWIQSIIQTMALCLSASGPEVTVAVPPLGCGNGKLDWNKVRPMIETGLQATRATIYLYGQD